MPRKSLPTPANDNGGLAARLRSALPPWRDGLYGAAAWGLAMAVSAQVALWHTNRAETFHFWTLTLLYFAGAALAWPAALYFTRLAALGRGARAWFAATMVFLSAATVGLTAGIFALIYRIFYSQWHADAFTVAWIYQQVFTTASAFYQFAVMGLRLYLPYGALALVVVAFAIARQKSRRAAKRRFSAP